MSTQDSSITWLRRIGLAEGTSFLLLLGVAMPLKYVYDIRMAVTVVGMAHGVLFLAYVAALVSTWGRRGWPVTRFLLGIVAAIIPFGPFAFDVILRREAGLSTPAPETT